MGIRVENNMGAATKTRGSLSFIMRFVFEPCKAGLIGFSTFFSVLIITKLAGYLLGSRPDFILDSEDLLLSSVGFLLVFLIRILENFKEK